MRLILTRDYIGADCSQGILTCNGGSWQTMERPWVPVDNAPCGKKGASCVPVGIYTLELHNSEAHPKSFALVNRDLWVYHWDEDMPPERRGLARSLVLTHSANFASELRGCIAPGRGRAVDPSGRRMVTQSKLAMQDLKALLPWTNKAKHTLEIK